MKTLAQMIEERNIDRPVSVEEHREYITDVLLQLTTISGHLSLIKEREQNGNANI